MMFCAEKIQTVIVRSVNKRRILVIWCPGLRVVPANGYYGCFGIKGVSLSHRWKGKMKCGPVLFFLIGFQLSLLDIY